MPGVNHLQCSGRALARQRGAATLIVVMVLFFIMSLVAAYASRNLIFEQRTSANQYRSTQALEAAEAGIEWAIAQLNNQRITNTCTNSISDTDPSFRQRYIAVDQVTGKLTAKTGTGNLELWPTCVLVGGQWACSCPTTGAPSLTAPTGPEVAPAFRVRFQQIDPPSPAAPGQAGVIRVQSAGCTRLSDQCLGFDSAGETNEGRVVVTALVALAGNAVGMPTAAVVARQDIALTGNATIVNSDAASSGVTLHAGGSIAVPAATLTGLAGTPGITSLVSNDSQLAFTQALPFTKDDRMFASLFNMGLGMFQEQPAAVKLSCSGPCSVTAVRDAIRLNPGRPIWVPTALVFDTAGDVGTAAEPVLLVVNGNLSFSASGTIHGLVYLRTDDWTTSGAGEIHGAVVADGSIIGAGTPTIVYDPALLTRLRVSTGSMVRVPSSWRDFR